MWQILLIISITALGDFFLKKASTQPNCWWNGYFWLGLTLYTLTTFLWVYVYTRMRLATASTLYGLLSILVLVTLGLVVFHEKLNMMEICGVILAVVALGLLSRFN